MIIPWISLNVPLFLLGILHWSTVQEITAVSRQVHEIILASTEYINKASTQVHEIKTSSTKVHLIKVASTQVRITPFPPSLMH